MTTKREIKQILEKVLTNWKENKELLLPDQSETKLLLSNKSLIKITPEFLELILASTIKYDLKYANYWLEKIPTIKELEIGSIINNLGYFLDDESYLVRIRCCKIIACLDGDSAIDYLVKALKDKDWNVQNIAEESLAELSDIVLPKIYKLLSRRKIFASW